MRELRWMGVLIRPGQIALTPTPLPDQSARRHWEKLTTAALDAQ